MLIVNADDFGGSVLATDAIARCFESGAITSSTFMVHMPDSERAAELALENDWAIGLHLNLTQPFEAAGLSRSTRDRHLEICEYFSDLSARRRLPEQRPHIRRMVRTAVDEQLERHQELFGRLPTHIDSHHHAHTANAALAALPAYIAVRRTASRRGELIAERFLTTDVFKSFPAIEEAAEIAQTQSVELMVHPSFEHELPVLLSEQWLAAMHDAPTGNFSDLEPVPGRLRSMMGSLPLESAAAILTDIPV